MVQLEALQTIATFRLFAHDVENGIDQFRAFRVMALCPIVTGTGLSEDEIVRSEELAEGSRTNRVHRTRLQIDEDDARDVFTTYNQTAGP